MNTAEKIESTIIEQIAAEKEKLSLMRKRAMMQLRHWSTTSVSWMKPGISQ